MSSPNNPHALWTEAPLDDMVRQYLVSSDADLSDDTNSPLATPPPEASDLLGVDGNLDNRPSFVNLPPPRSSSAPIAIVRGYARRVVAANLSVPRVSYAAQTVVDNISASLSRLDSYPHLAPLRQVLQDAQSPPFRGLLGLMADNLLIENRQRRSWSELLNDHVSISFRSLCSHVDGTRVSPFFQQHYRTDRAPFFAQSTLDGGGTFDCAICCTAFDDVATICILLPCQHVFHVACFTRHVQTPTQSAAPLSDLAVAKHERLRSLNVRCCLCRETCHWNEFSTNAFQSAHMAHVAHDT